MRKKILAGSFLMAFLIIGLTGISQPSLSGPSCVTPGIVYMYDVNSDNLSSALDMHICVTGGIVADSGSACISGQYFSFVRVIWNANAISGTISLTSSLGNSSKNVSITPALQGGLVTDTSEVIAYNVVPSLIHCTAASGGNCSPAYSYQWQQSADQFYWTDVSGTGSQNLSLSAGLTETTFYRRKVSETGSGSIGYSSIATVFVNPEPPNGN